MPIDLKIFILKALLVIVGVSAALGCVVAVLMIPLWISGYSLNAISLLKRK
jgi:hypothetical protein